MPSLKSEYQLDPNVTYLNHGSFGACPRVVFAAYQNWQRELEVNPVDFIGSKLTGLMSEARAKLAAYLGAGNGEVVYFTNPTTAINMAARSVDLKPGDEILTTQFEYGAMEATWNYIAHKTGAKYIHQPTPLPVKTNAEFVEAFWQGVNARTRVIFISHIAPFLALIFPIKEICWRARAAGIITIIDGAHAPSQIPLNLKDIGADVYVGACHKWLSAPKGSGFMYARTEAQAWLEPLVISGGWVEEKPIPKVSAPDGRSWLVTYNEGQGTRDPSAFLSVPSAIKFQEDRNWDEQRQRCHQLASSTRQRINTLTGLPELSPDSNEFFSQMASVLLPAEHVASVGKRLWEEFHIVAPIIPVLEKSALRYSFQAYNDEADADILVNAIKTILGKKG
jgi:isopenicillin-N epimerase